MSGDPLLYRSAKQAGDALKRPVVAIGNFDGVHRGHRAVIAQAASLAAETGTDSAVLTFEPHPVRYFRPDTPPFRLTTLEQKAAYLEEAGIDAVVAATFDEALASLAPREFVEEILVNALRASAILVGEDFRFGSGRAGDIATLRTLGDEHGFRVVPIAQVREESDVISSTAIRTALRNGNLERVTELLGRPYAIVGTIIQGDQQGREYGFPTANLDTPNPLLPPDGIYATRLTDPVEGEFGAATYVGTRPTVDGTTRNVEAYCLDVPDGFDIYGHAVELAFLSQVRGDEHFPGIDEMIEQMHIDVATVRERLA